MGHTSTVRGLRLGAVALIAAFAIIGFVSVRQALAFPGDDHFSATSLEYYIGTPAFGGMGMPVYGYPVVDTWQQQDAGQSEVHDAQDNDTGYRIDYVVGWDNVCENGEDFAGCDVKNNVQLTLTHPDSDALPLFELQAEATAKSTRSAGVGQSNVSFSLLMCSPSCSAPAALAGPDADAFPFSIYIENGYELKGTVRVHEPEYFDTFFDFSGTGVRFPGFELENVRLEKDGESWFLLSGTFARAQSFIEVPFAPPSIQFFPEKLLPNGKWVPYGGEWHNGIVRVRVVCTPGTLPIRADSTPSRFWFEQDGVFTVPAGAVPGWRCTDTAGNRATSGPADPIVVRVDRRAPKCTVTPSPAAFSRNKALQTVNVTVSPGSSPAPAVATWLVSVTGGAPGDAIGWTAGTPDFQGQLEGGGRKTYTLTYAVQDAAGNVGTCSALVKVT